MCIKPVLAYIYVSIQKKKSFISSEYLQTNKIL